ncbi:MULTISPECIES: hypothetical protein [Prauserella salsuginis group]|uniref:Uncharacterized protein n=2 Tax=Prauserella salsuginis group TaxID=2893672 RepID=A0A839XW48_9PSEU|nr:MULTISPECIES: hypothetical protein [Prauserella salsuginis group]MBB3666379.1 hypothetical protein [Prauserella sediminis]MCR3719168.1 hypothetical protein [Prauserella flava]MCR3735819.1 hypothetical protein [Prauserella salsuginis]
MTARWHDTRPEPRDDAGPGALAGCAFLAFVAIYMGLHVLLWVGQVVIA